MLAWDAASRLPKPADLLIGDTDLPSTVLDVALMLPILRSALRENSVLSIVLRSNLLSYFYSSSFRIVTGLTSTIIQSVLWIAKKISEICKDTAVP